MNEVAFWAYEACPRGLAGGRGSHSRLGLVHRLREGDQRHACEDVADPATSTVHHRSVACEDTTEDQAPLEMPGMWEAADLSGGWADTNG